MFKSALKKNIRIENVNELKSKMKSLSKCSKVLDGEFGPKKYFKELQIEQARQKFRIKTRMIEVKFNYRNDKQNSKDNWKCDSCESGFQLTR